MDSKFTVYVAGAPEIIFSITRDVTAAQMLESIKAEGGVITPNVVINDVSKIISIIKS